MKRERFKRFHFVMLKGHTKFFIFVLLFFIFAGCKVQTPTELISRDLAYFLIEPTTFLSDFQNGNFSAFDPYGNIRPDESLVLGAYISNWSTNDFRSIAEERHKVVWDEAINEWELQAIHFNWDCEYLDNGPQDACYSFYKVEETEDNALLFISKISIVPRRKTVSVSQEVFSPLNNVPERIPIAQVEESMLMALSIAEENGGTQIRENRNNECNISVAFNTNLVQSDNWIVDYVKREGGPIESFYINPISGELLE